MISDELWYLIGAVFFIVLVLSLLYQRCIMAVYDKNDDLSFKVYQKGILIFLVKGYNGYPKKVSFRSYVDVVAYIDKHINGF